MAGLTLQEIKPDELYECAVAHLSPAGSSQEGQTLRGSDPRIQFAPHLFCRVGDPVRPSPFDTAVEANEKRSRELEEDRKRRFAAAAKAHKVKIEEPKLLTAKRDVVGELDGQPTTLEKGSKMASNHPFVLEHGDAFA